MINRLPDAWLAEDKPTTPPLTIIAVIELHCSQNPTHIPSIDRAVSLPLATSRFSTTSSQQHYFLCNERRHEQALILHRFFTGSLWCCGLSLRLAHVSDSCSCRVDIGTSLLSPSMQCAAVGIARPGYTSTRTNITLLVRERSRRHRSSPQNIVDP